MCDFIQHMPLTWRLGGQARLRFSENGFPSINEVVSSQSHVAKRQNDALLAFISSNAYSHSKEGLTGGKKIQ